MNTYLITQASGGQAQAIIKHLLATGARIHALVRNPETASSLPLLKSPGVTVFKGSNLESDAIFEAAQGCKGVFLNTFPDPTEPQQAKTILDACKRAGVETVVASTTFWTGDRDIWDNAECEHILLRSYYLSKTAVEDAVRRAGFESYTILRPGFIYFDFLLPKVHMNFPELPTAGELVHAYDDGVKMVYTDEDDIGKYGAAALLDPVRFDGQAVDLMSEGLTINEVYGALDRVSGRKIQLRKLTTTEIEELKSSDSFFYPRFHLFANLKPLVPNTNVAEEKFGIPMTSFESYLERNKEALLATLLVRS